MGQEVNLNKYGVREGFKIMNIGTPLEDVIIFENTMNKLQYSWVLPIVLSETIC